MPKIKIITDTTSYLEKEYAVEKNVDVMPIYMEIDGETYKEGHPSENANVFEKFLNSKKIPTTSQPPIGQFIETFEKAIKDGFEIVGIFMSEKTSGTFNTAKMAANMTSEDKIRIIDSKTSGPNLKYLVKKAVELCEKGLSKEEIEARIDEQKKNMNVMMFFETLDYLKKAGRVSNTKALVGNILNIKPIIGVVDGEICPIGKVRGTKRAMDFVLDRIPENVKNISVCHVDNIKDGEKLKNLINQKFPHIEIDMDPLGPSLGIQFGPRTIGVCCSW